MTQHKTPPHTRDSLVAAQHVYTTDLNFYVDTQKEPCLIRFSKLIISIHVMYIYIYNISISKVFPPIPTYTHYRLHTPSLKLNNIKKRHPHSSENILSTSLPPPKKQDPFRIYIFLGDGMTPSPSPWRSLKTPWRRVEVLPK